MQISYKTRRKDSHIQALKYALPPQNPVVGLITFASIIPVLWACGSLRKVEQHKAGHSLTQKVKLLKDSMVQEQQKSILLMVKRQADSTQLDYVLEIWPKGKFNITAQGAFEGEAQKIKLQGQARQMKKSYQLGQQVEAISSLKSLHIKSEAESKVVDKQVLLKKNPAWLTALLLLALAIGINIAIYYYHKPGTAGRRLL